MTPTPALPTAQSLPLAEHVPAPGLACAASLPAEPAAVRTPEWHKFWGTAEAPETGTRGWTQFGNPAADAGSPKGPQGWTDPGEI